MKTININGKDFTIEEPNDIIGGSKQETKTLEQLKEERFLELFQGLEMRSDIEKYPDSVFFFRGDKYVLEREKHYLWVNYSEVWKVFQNEFGMNASEIQSFIKSMVEKHFKMVGVTPGGFYWRPTMGVEKHFKMVGVTPKRVDVEFQNMVEKHFKMVGVAPRRV